MGRDSRYRGPYFWMRYSTRIIACLALFCGEVAQGGWIDPDSPEHVRSTAAYTPGDNREYEMVFSDEFNVDGRTFHDGNDPRWTAIHKNDCEFLSSGIAFL